MTKTWNGLEPLRKHLVALEELTPDPRNARKHGEQNLAAIRSSLARFGQRKPLVAQRAADDRLVVRAGNGTLLAARAEGWTHVAVFVVDEDDRQATAFALADNRSAELAEWDEPQLDVILKELEGLGDDLAGLGWDKDALAQLVDVVAHQRAIAPPGDPDAVEEPPAAPVARTGEIWTLGDHRIACGDSTDAEAVGRLLAGELPRLLLTDPPYGVELDMEWRDRAGHNSLAKAQPSYMRKQGHRNTEISGDTRADWSQAFELVPSLDTAYVWHASSFTIDVGLGLRRIGFELKQQIIWRKPHFALSRQHYHWQHEPAWYARKAKALPFRGTRDQATIWDAASPKMLMTGGDEEKFDHPTQKPIVLYTRPIENHLRRGEVFYEPFSGSGSAIAAAETTGRRCLAMEIDPKYVDVAVNRWEKLTGRKADRKG